MENMSSEVIECIESSFDGDEELIKDCLFYLYHTTNDEKLKEKIVIWFNKNGYCITCGGKLTRYEYDEIHTELEYDNVESCYVDLCPLCDMPNEQYKEIKNESDY